MRKKGNTMTKAVINPSPSTLTIRQVSDISPEELTSIREKNAEQDPQAFGENQEAVQV